MNGSGDNINKIENIVYGGGNIANGRGNNVNGGKINMNEGEGTVNRDQNTANKEEDFMNGGDILEMKRGNTINVVYTYYE